MNVTIASQDAHPYAVRYESEACRSAVQTVDITVGHRFLMLTSQAEAYQLSDRKVGERLAKQDRHRRSPCSADNSPTAVVIPTVEQFAELPARLSEDQKMLDLDGDEEVDQVPVEQLGQ